MPPPFIDHTYPYPEDLPEELRELWDIGSDIHFGNEEKFRWWLSRMIDYLKKVET